GGWLRPDEWRRHLGHGAAQTSTPAPSRSTTSPIIRSRAPDCWVRSAWNGSSAASPPIPRPAPWGGRTAQPLSSWRQWPVSAAARLTPRIPPPRDRDITTVVSDDAAACARVAGERSIAQRLYLEQETHHSAS